MGSITQASTVQIADGVNIPLSHLLPSVNPNDLVIDGWDISSKNLAEATERAQVLEPTLQQQLQSHLAKMIPRPAVFDQDFIAENQVCRCYTHS